MNEYIDTLLNTIPGSVYVVLICAAVVYSLFIIGIKGVKEGFKQTSIGLLFMYAIFIVFATVVYRPVVGYEIRLIPFGSYFDLYDGCERAFEENLMNVIAFVPIGLLLTVGAKKQSWKCVAFIGLSFSLVIEFLQFQYNRGIGEIDDLIHNTIGCVMGCFVAKAIMKLNIVNCFSK